MKRTFTFLFLLFSFLSFGFDHYSCQHRKHLLHQHKNQFRSGEEALRSDTIDVLNYSIYLDFTNADLDVISGSCQVKFKPKMNVNSLTLDLLQMTVDSVVMHNDLLLFSYNDTLLKVNFGTVLNADEVDSITVYYHGDPQTDPSGWGGYYSSGGYYFNLGVGFASIPHNYGRVWHPCFDNFVERASYDFQILTDGGNTAYCNGTRQSVINVGLDSLLATWKLNDEIPTYLASFAVSSYTHVSQIYTSDLFGYSVPVWLIARPADTTNLKNSFVHLFDAIEAFENFFGEHQWEKIGFVLVPFSSGAMEHATNIAYPLITANGTTAYETLMAHELSHHWWGDYVTCETAEEMWINEGFARYCEHLFLEWVYGKQNYMQAMRNNHYDVLHKAHINDSGYYALNAVPVKFTYGDHSYNKGADVLHTIRHVMGDAAFWQGLHAVQNNYGDGTISSEEFMNQLNTSSGVDVTDLFNNWIFQPGFAHFGIINLIVVPEGGQYNVTVWVAQKLKGGADYHVNTPLQITFMDDNWNVHTEEIILQGAYDAFEFTLNMNPVFAGVNLNEKINDATTAQMDTINEDGIYSWNYANIRLKVNEIIDSAFVRIEHNWVYPDVMNVPDDIQISMQRYWNIHGVDLENITGELRFEFNGKTTGNGFLDHQLLVDLGNQPFSEDSIVLLYRPDAQSSWVVHDNYTISFTGSHTDKSGYITTNNFKKGQYAFGYRTNSVGINENQNKDFIYSIYPNPATDSLIIDLTEWDAKNYHLEIVGLEGNLVFKTTILGGQKNMLSLNQISKGTYLIVISSADGMIKGTKRVVVM